MIAHADAAAHYTRELGFALTPLRERTKDAYRSAWNTKDACIMDPGEARTHWSRRPGENLGAVLAFSTRHGLNTFDVDHPEETRVALAAVGLGLDSVLDASPLTIVGHPDRAKRVFRTPEGVTLAHRILAWPPRAPGEKPLKVFELRAGPVQDVLPPSIHPDTGKPYSWAPRCPRAVEEIPELSGYLLLLWQRWDEFEPQMRAACPWGDCEREEEPKGATHGAAAGPGWERVRALIRQKKPLGEYLEELGAVEKGMGSYLCPFHEEKRPSFWTFGEGRDKWVCSHGGAPCGHETPRGFSSGDVIDLFAWKEGLELGPATAELARQLGIPLPEERVEASGEDPLPILDTLPAVPPFDPILLPEALRPWVEDIAERMQCPPDFPAVGAMVALSATVGRQVAIRPKRRDDWTVVPNVWGGVVGRPGILKTPALSEALRYVRKLELEARVAFEAQQRDHAIKGVLGKAAAEGAKEQIKKLLKEKKNQEAEDLARGVFGDDEKPPSRRRYLTNDTTVEKLGELLASNPRGILVFRDELTALLRSLDKEDQVSARGFYLEAWDGNTPHTVDRIQRGTVDVDAACVAVLGGIQPGPLSAYLRGALAGGQGDDGLLQRFQLVTWPDPPRHWCNVDRYPNTAAKEAAGEVFVRLDSLDIQRIGGQRDDPDGLPFLHFAPAGQAVFDEWHASLEARLRSDLEHPAFESHLAKYRSLLPSLALLIHLADGNEGGVGEASVVAALGWVEYLEAHARRLYAPALNPAAACARELDRHLLKGDLPTPFTAREVYFKGWALLDRDGTFLALDFLESLHRVIPEKVSHGNDGGRPTTCYHLHPALKKGGVG